jgi:hypothetical protein
MARRTTDDGLLVECEPYFLDGVHTIARFSQRTQEIVREAVNRHWDSLVEALGFAYDEVSLVDYCYPDKLQKAKPTDEVNLGVKIKFSDVFEAAIYRYWEVDEKSSGIAIWTWVNRRTTLDRLSTEIDNLPDEPPGPADTWSFDTGSNGTYFIVRELGESEIGELNLRLDELVAYYIGLVTNVGGVQKFISAAPNSAA